MTKEFHREAIQKWESQEYKNTSFDMSHLNAHELIIHSKKWIINSLLLTDCTVLLRMIRHFHYLYQ